MQMARKSKLNKELIEQLFININTFLKYGGYGEEKGFAPTSTKYLKIILNGIKREAKAMI